MPAESPDERRKREILTLLEEAYKLRFEIERDLLVTTSPIDRARLTKDLTNLSIQIKDLEKELREIELRNDKLIAGSNLASELISLISQVAEAGAVQDSARVVELAKQVLDLDAGNTYAIHKLEKAYSQLAYDEAYSDLSKTVESQPNNVLLYIQRAEVSLKKGNFQPAFDDLRRAIELDPNNANAYYVRGRLHQSRGDKKSALNDFRRAADLGHKKAREKLKLLSK